MSPVFDKDGSDKDLPDEQQLEEYLRGGSAVSRQYRQLPSAEVPADLDRLVLRQAQEAVKARPAKSRTWMRWTGPLALAASAVLVVSIVIESGVHKETYVAAPASAPMETELQEEPAKQELVGSAADKPMAAAAAKDAPVVPVVPVEQPERTFATVPEPKALEITEPQDRMFAIQQTAPPPVAAPAPQLQRAEPTEEVTVRSARSQERMEVNSTPIAMPAPADGFDRDQALEDIVTTGMSKRERKQTAGPRNTVAAPAAADSASNAAEEADEARSYFDPEQWLKDIRQLRKENKHDAADREWLRFRSVYPNYAVAEDDVARGVLR